VHGRHRPLTSLLSTLLTSGKLRLTNDGPPPAPQVYTAAVIFFIYTVHVQQKRLQQGTAPSDDLLFDAGELPGLTKPGAEAPASPPEEEVLAEGARSVSTPKILYSTVSSATTVSQGELL
jgi:hypothetical protein